MKPIISPWLIYLMSVLDGINTLGAIVFFFGLVAIPVSLFALYSVYDYHSSFGEEENSLKKAFSNVKPFIIGYAIFVSVSCFIPSKTTMYQMIVAKELTPDNISTITQAAGNTAEDVADYVVDIITRVSEAVKEND